MNAIKSWLRVNRLNRLSVALLLAAWPMPLLIVVPLLWRYRWLLWGIWR